MALPPQFAGHRIGSATAPQTLEVWLDYVCPYSFRIYKRLRDVRQQFESCAFRSATYDHLVSLFTTDSAPFDRPLQQILPYIEATHPGKVKFIFRQQVQPWHPSSTLVHEAALAVEKVDPAKFFDFSDKLFEKQKEFFDVPLYNKTRHAVYSELADLASTVGVSRDAVLSLLTVQLGGEFLNAGNRVTDDLKLQIKLGRQNGIHVSPTVVWDGIRDDNVSSGWDLEQWKDWLKSKVHKQ
ncbi:thioredoxin-like protein [Jimgerdemannia flammicorona]|uniref:Thioredoxin-like protein n=1 Tax=Jimgerdemannia flammicorona TaxID=994334 RepID=A0A433D162_9FUNG|nr:thioredoxin-like protein [Jimgerdemannia flammicorona]